MTGRRNRAADRRSEAARKRMRHPTVEQYVGNDWMSQAGCLGMDLDLFYIQEHYQLAMDVCEKCEVMVACLEDAVDGNDVKEGVRGGAIPFVRQQIRFGRYGGEMPVDFDERNDDD